MIRNLIHYIFLLSFLAPLHLFTQQPDDYLRFRRLSLEQGLSQSTVNHILQDQNGFLWIATQDGLNRYDGYGFFVYKYQPSDTNSIPNNFVISLAEDRNRNCLWIATHGGGLAKLDFHTGNFQRYYHRPEDTNSIADNYLNDIRLDHSGILWIGTRDKGLVRYDPDQNCFFSYQSNPAAPKGLKNARVRTIYEDSKHRLWIGSAIGLLRMDAERKMFSEMALHNRRDEIVIDIIEDHRGIFWFGTDGIGLFRYDPVTEFIQSFTHDPNNRHSVSSNEIRCLYEDSGHNLWIGTNYGLNRLIAANTGTASGYKFLSFYSDPSDIYSLSNNIVQSLLADRFDNLWVGTNGGGLNMYSGSGRIFMLYSNKSLRMEKGSINDVLSIAQDRHGNLWSGTWGDGLTIIDRKNNRYRLFRHDPRNKQSIPENSVFALLPDTGGIMWVGTYNGLSRISCKTDIMTGQTLFKHFPADPDKPDRLNHPKIRCMIKTNDGKIWIGTYGGGINVFDPLTERFDVIRHEPGNARTVSNNNIWVIHEDQSGDIWVGTYGGGLNRYQRSEKRWTTYIHNPYDPETLSNDVVLSIYSDTAGVWIGTRAGLNYLNRTSGRFRCYTTRHGLPNDVIYGILPDRQGNLWISTNLGVSKVTLNADSVSAFRNYDINSGLQGNEFNIGAYYQNEQGEMFFGGINGLNSFFPDSIRINTVSPSVIITAFKKFDKTVYSAPSINNRSVIELNYKDNFFSIDFAALDFTDPGKNRYAYQLKGFDDEWIYCGSRRYATYTNLDGGTYRFKVKGTNHDGVWSEQSASIQIIIHPPVWKTLWFRATAVLMLAGLIYILVQWRFRSIKNQKQELEAQVRLRTLEVTEKNERLQSALDEIREQKNTLDRINLLLTRALEELRQSQNQLIQSEKMAALGHLVGGIAHEINNPLSFVDGNLSYFSDYMHHAIRMMQEIENLLSSPSVMNPHEILQSVSELKQKYDYHYIVNDSEKLINACRHGTQRIKKIVDDLRNFSSTDESRLVLSDIGQCIDQAIASLSHVLKKEIEIHKHYDNIPPACCFPGLLTQALRHILLNAIQAIEHNGRIDITTRLAYKTDASPPNPAQQVIGIIITDNGAGIPPDVIPKIFDPFFTTKQVGQGTGLGLTIAYNIIKRHDGIINCHSELKRRTTFEMNIPFRTTPSSGAGDHA